MKQLSMKKTGFLGITEKEIDFSRFMHSLYLGDYVYWLITFDTRYKHHCREIELAIKKDIHIRMLILKECAMPYLDWQSELKQNSGYLFESDKWKIPDIF